MKIYSLIPFKKKGEGPNYVVTSQSLNNNYVNKFL